MTKNNHGFTLIELIVTVAMIGIIIAAGGAELGTFLKRNKIVTQTNNFVGSLNIARSEAAKRASNVTVCIGNTAQDTCAGGANWESGWIVFVDNNNDAVIDAGETILNVNNEVSGNTTIRSTQFVSSITYRGDGSVVSSGTFRICDATEAETDKRAKAISVMGSGLISQGKDNTSDGIVDDYLGVSISCP